MCAAARGSAGSKHLHGRIREPYRRLYVCVEIDTSSSQRRSIHGGRQPTQVYIYVSACMPSFA